MTLAEAKTLHKGTKVMWSQGDGWWQEAKFLGLTEFTTYKSLTYQDIADKNFDFGKNGKKSLEAHISFTDDDGRQKDAYVSLRTIRRA